MATLAGQTVLIVGGTSGIGFGVAKLSLLSNAAHVVVASSQQVNVDNAVKRLAEHTAADSKVTGEVVDGKDAESIKALLKKVGEIDHLVWTSGNSPAQASSETDPLRLNKSRFDIRFWGPTLAAEHAKFKEGGSIVFTTGAVFKKPRAGFSMFSAVTGALDALTRGLAFDMAPIRVNVVCPGLVTTELIDKMIPAAQRGAYIEGQAQKLPVKHIANADEVAEAYLFLMKCKYMTGQRIEIDGGVSLI